MSRPIGYKDTLEEARYQKTIPCPKCQSFTKILSSSVSIYNTLRRRRQCSKCLFRFSTYESVPSPNGVPLVQKGQPTKLLQEPARAKFVELMSPTIEFLQFHIPELFKEQKMPNELSKNFCGRMNGWMNSVENDE